MKPLRMQYSQLFYESRKCVPLNFRLQIKFFLKKAFFVDLQEGQEGASSTVNSSSQEVKIDVQVQHGAKA